MDVREEEKDEVEVREAVAELAEDDEGVDAGDRVEEDDLVDDGVTEEVMDDVWLALGYSTFEIIRTTLLFESEKYKFPYAVSMQR